MKRASMLELQHATNAGIAMLKFCVELAEARGLSLKPGYPTWNTSGHIESGKTQWLRFSTRDVEMREYYFETAQLVDYAQARDRAVVMVNVRMKNLLTDLMAAQLS
jgi:hypothetical protein